MCQDFFTQNLTNTEALICIPCPDDPLCITCEPIEFICQNCVPNSNLINGQCSCEDGFFRSDSECVPCPGGCLNCINLDICESCQANRNEDNVPTRGSPSSGCKCLDGFYEIDEPICPPCHPLCLTCEGTAETCTSCDEEKNFVLDGTTCKCKLGFYLLETEETAVCAPCDTKCEGCEISPVYCTSCREDDFRVLTGTSQSGISTCSCKNGYVEYQGECLDEDCGDSVPFCQTCLLDPQFKTT